MKTLYLCDTHHQAMKEQTASRIIVPGNSFSDRVAAFNADFEIQPALPPIHPCAVCSLPFLANDPTLRQCPDCKHPDDHDRNCLMNAVRKGRAARR